MKIALRCNLGIKNTLNFLLNLTSRLPTKPQGVMGLVWLGGAAIRARYKWWRTSQGSDAEQACVPTKQLREVLADQSDRARHASVIEWHETVESH